MMPSSLAELAALPTIGTASPFQIVPLLDELRSLLEGGVVDRDRRANSSSGLAFVGLHRRLYGRLADLKAGDELDRVDVLARRGSRLAYRPRAEVRHVGVVMPESPPVYHLRENLRSTRAIHEFAQRFAVGLGASACLSWA